MNAEKLCSLLAIACLSLPSPQAYAEGGIFMRETAGGSIELTNIPDDDSYQALIQAEMAAVGASGAVSNEVPSAPLIARVAQYRELVADAARHADVEPRLLHAIVAVESAYNPKAVSPKGAVGLMQLMPATIRHLGITDARDPLQNLRGGATHLRELLNRFSNDVSLALAAYNAGVTAVLRHGKRIPPYPETSSYVPKVLGVYRKLKSVVN